VSRFLQKLETLTSTARLPRVFRVRTNVRTEHLYSVETHFSVSRQDEGCLFAYARSYCIIHSLCTSAASSPLP
jgi:hypothetical protein